MGGGGRMGHGGRGESLSEFLTRKQIRIPRHQIPRFVILLDFPFLTRNFARLITKVSKYRPK